MAWLFENALCSATSLSTKTRSTSLIFITATRGWPVVTKCFGCFCLVLAGYWGCWMQPVKFSKAKCVLIQNSSAAFLKNTSVTYWKIEGTQKSTNTSFPSNKCLMKNGKSTSKTLLKSRKCMITCIIQIYQCFQFSWFECLIFRNVFICESLWGMRGGCMRKYPDLSNFPKGVWSPSWIAKTTSEM